MRVYIAGPCTKGDVAENVRNALEAGNRVAEAGHTPFIPHLSHFWHFVFPHEYQFWMRQDMAWLDVCDALICLPGPSAGAEQEVRHALVDLKIAVYFSVESFLNDNPHGS